MSEKWINVTFLLLTCMSFFFIIMMFFYWNPFYSTKIFISDKKLVHFDIEQCSFNKENIYIRGWAYVLNEKHSNTFIYAQITSGDYIPIRTNSQFRSDLQNPFEKSPFNTLGFIASRKIFRNNSFTKKIIVIINNEYGKQYAAHYTCS